MRPSKVLSKLREGKPAIFYGMALNDPSVWELASLIGLDCLWLDLEHHAHSMETAGTLIRAARVGSSDVIARPGKGEWMRMSRMLEAGANGIMYPRCSDAKEAREVVRWCKFAPLGERGFDGGNPDMPYCSMDVPNYIRVANKETFVIIQIESQQSLDQVEKILDVEGVDGVMLGPADFTVLSGIPGEFNHPKVQQAVERIAKAAESSGKWWGMPSPNVERSKMIMDMGAKLIFTGADILAVKNALEQLRQDYTPLGLSFDYQLNSD